MTTSNSKREQDVKRVEKEWNAVDNAVIKSESFIERNFKPILLGLGALVALACVYLAAKQFYFAPKNQKAQVALFKGEEYFRNQQDSIALYGNGRDFDGLISFINEYGSTPSGNIANAYAGIALSRLKNYDQAIKYLKAFNGKDKLISYAVEGAIGDCYANQNKLEEAAKLFEKAAKGAESTLLSPVLLMKAGIAYRQLGNHKKVIETLTTLRNEYANSPEAVRAEKYIEEANILLNKNQ